MRVHVDEPGGHNGAADIDGARGRLVDLTERHDAPVAHTDVTGSPAYENAIAAAHDAVDAVRRYLG